MNQNSFQLQQAIKALLDAHRPKIRLVHGGENNGRSVEVRIKNQMIKLPIENSQPYRSTTGSFR